MLEKIVKKYVLLVIVCCSHCTYSQKKILPDENDIAQAIRLKEKFSEDLLAIESSKDFVTFDFDTRSQKVKVNQKSSSRIINLESRTSIQDHIFYDGESTIKNFKVTYKSGKKVFLFPMDEAYSSDGLFHNDARVKFVNLNFPLRGYKYNIIKEKEYKDIKYFTSLGFNERYPIVNKEIVIEVPDWLEVEFKEFNFDGYSIKKDSVAKNASTVYTYSINNIPAYSKENNTPGPSYIYPHLLVLSKAHIIKGNRTVLFDTTKDLYTWYKSLVGELENTKKSYVAKVNELTKNARTDEEKIKNIYYWVQDNIRYIAFEDGIAGFKPDEAGNVFDKRYGDCKGMANLTKQMLKEAGFDARLTWIGTKRIAYDYSTPSLSVDNHMICTLIKDGQYIFLDGTEKYNSLGEYAGRIEGKEVLIENGENYILKTVPVVDAAFNKRTVNYYLKLDDEIVSGTGIKRYEGENKTYILNLVNDYLIKDDKEKVLKKFLSNNDPNLKVSDVMTSEFSDRDVALDMTYNLELKNSVSSFDGEIYLDLDFDKDFSSYDFSERESDFVFDFKEEFESITELEIPENYKVLQFPKNIEVTTADYDISLSYSLKGNTVLYKKRFLLKNEKILASNFKTWNSMIKKLKETYNDQIILKNKL